MRTIVQTSAKRFRVCILALTLAALGCHAQTPAASLGPLSPELARRVEVQIRARMNVPPDYELTVGPRVKSDVAGYDAVDIIVSANGKTSRPVRFLLSEDNKTLAQFSKYDISKDPKELVSAAGRPSRGGPANAPVVVVGFDDLECPYCAKMHEQLFPALTERYGDKVHFVYRDFPLEIHPWAMRAAIDVNCVAAQSAAGYWNMVDFIHAHAAELGGEEKSLAKANDTLDALARAQGKSEKLNESALDACITKQDNSAIKASIEAGDALGVDSTPVLYINGEKLEGAMPMALVYRMIDSALVAAGQTPPPPASPTSAPQTSPQTPQTPPAAKPGN